MAYCLENAVAAVRDANPWLLESVDFEPLEGITDGKNRIVRTPHKPLDQASNITIYRQDGTSVGSANYSVVSWDSGVLRFTQGLTEQYYADYSVADPYYSATRLKELCRSGFRLMMTRAPQSWYLVDSGGSTWISDDATTVSDPAIGAITFSTSHQALKAFHLCCEYELASSRLRQAAALDVDYREGMSGGVQVTTKNRAAALQSLLDQLGKEIDTSLTVLEEEISGSGWGGFVSGAKSDAYESTYEWWDDTDQAASS